MTTRARPCDSPAVRNRNISPGSYTKFLHPPRALGPRRRRRAQRRRSRSCTATPWFTSMRIVADRFLLVDEDGGTEGAATDLATGAAARVFVDPQPGSADVRERTALCDRLAMLRHPLLLPLLDYGTSGRQWFEAHAVAAPLRMSAAQIRRAVLHVVRFLRANGIELTSPG